MKKLLEINVTANQGSTGRIANSVGIAAQNNGYDTTLAYGRYMNKTPLKTIKIGNKLSNYRHVLESRILDNHGLASIAATKKFVNDVKALEPDIIHLHNLHGYYLNYQILFEYLKMWGGPVVWTLHDCWPFTGHCSHFVNSDCARWQTGCHNCPNQHCYPKSFLLDRSKANWDKKNLIFNSIDNLTIVSVSNWLDTLVSESFLSGKNHMYIYNGVDTEVFLPRETDMRMRYGLEGKLLMVGVANVWSRSKGFDDYVKLSNHLKDDEIIVMIGVNKELAKSLPSNIIGVPKTENLQELVSWYNAADMVLNLSYQETFGMTTAEGLSCGTPGISYNVTACPEVLSSDTGIIVSLGHIDEVYHAIQEIKIRTKEGYKFQCRERALTNFDINKNYQQYIDLFDYLTTR